MIEENRKLILEEGYRPTDKLDVSNPPGNIHGDLLYHTEFLPMFEISTRIVFPLES
jgi:hypothetical protein